MTTTTANMRKQILFSIKNEELYFDYFMSRLKMEICTQGQFLQNTGRRKPPERMHVAAIMVQKQYSLVQGTACQMAILVDNIYLGTKHFVKTRFLHFQGSILSCSKLGPVFNLSAQTRRNIRTISKVQFICAFCEASKSSVRYPFPENVSSKNKGRSRTNPKRPVPGRVSKRQQTQQSYYLQGNFDLERQFSG